MSTAGVSGLLVISMIAVAAPVLAAIVQRARVPDVVIEIVAGIVVGPSVLGWVKIDQPVGLVALLGLAFLLFLAGLEVDLKVITPSRLRAPLAGYAASLLLGSAAGFAFHAAGWVRSPLFLAITLSSSSLGLVVPVLADARQSRTLLGQLTIAGATLGEFGAITLLSLFFSATRGGTASNAITFGIFGVAAAAVGLTLSRADRSLAGRLPHPAPEHDGRDPGPDRRRAPDRIRCPRGEDRTADHPRRLPGRRHPQHRRPRHGQSPALPHEARRSGLRLPHPGILRLQRRRVRPDRPDARPLCAG